MPILVIRNGISRSLIQVANLVKLVLASAWPIRASGRFWAFMACPDSTWLTISSPYPWLMWLRMGDLSRRRVARRRGAESILSSQTTVAVQLRCHPWCLFLIELSYFCSIESIANFTTNPDLELTELRRMSVGDGGWTLGPSRCAPLSKKD